MHDELRELKSFLADRRYSLTAPRQAIFVALHHEPRTIPQLIAAAPQIDRASVYRTVALFEQIGIIQRLQQGWKYKLELTDTFSAHHHHLSCLQCKRIISINEQTLEVFLEQLAETHQFTAQAHQVEVQGICRQCTEMTEVVK